MEWAKVPSFVWEKVRFADFKSYMFNSATVCETPMLKIFKLLEKVFSIQTVHRKSSFS